MVTKEAKFLIVNYQLTTDEKDKHGNDSVLLDNHVSHSDRVGYMKANPTTSSLCRWAERLLEN